MLSAMAQQESQNISSEECPYCKAIPEEILEDCFVQGYRILCNDNRKVVENFLEKIEKILQPERNKTFSFHGSNDFFTKTLDKAKKIV